MSSSSAEEYICPISHEIMKEPVIAADGYSYERECIENWFTHGNSTSPITGSVLSNLTITPNLTLRSLIKVHAEEGMKEKLVRNNFDTAESMNTRLEMLLKLASLTHNPAKEFELLITRLTCLSVEHHDNAAEMLITRHPNIVFENSFSDSYPVPSRYINMKIREIRAARGNLGNEAKAYLGDAITPKLQVIVEDCPLLHRVIQIPGISTPREYVIVPEKLPSPYSLTVTHVNLEPAYLVLFLDDVFLDSRIMIYPGETFTFKHWKTHDTEGRLALAPLEFIQAEANENAKEQDANISDSSFFKIEIYKASYDKEKKWTPNVGVTDGWSLPTWIARCDKKKGFTARSGFGALQPVQGSLCSQPPKGEPTIRVGKWEIGDYVGSMEVYYDSASALMLRGIPAEFLGLSCVASKQIEERVERDRNLKRAKKRSMELADATYVYEADLTADDGTETWIKRSRRLEEIIEVS